MSAVTRLVYFPLKSGAGIVTDYLEGGPSGIINDRQFCLYKPAEKKFISMRDIVGVSDVCVYVNADGIHVKAGGILQCFQSVSGSDDTIKVWSRDVDVIALRGAISDFISRYLSESVILAKIKHPKNISQSFMDTGPIHIISHEALRRLSIACQYELLDPMIFRPNIVVSEFEGDEADIQSVIINGFSFSVMERTERCTAITVLHKKIHDTQNSHLLQKLDESIGSDGAPFGLYLQANEDFKITEADTVKFYCK